MNYLELGFADPASNLAYDEALLNFCEHKQIDGVLRIWEPSNYFVVLGYSNKLASEVHVDQCQSRDIPILRRFSGGGTVLQGPGCFNYSLVLPNEMLGRVIDMTASYERVLQRHRKIFVDLLGSAIEIAGTADLAVNGRKFSGNAQHRRRHYTLFHGTFLLDFDLSLIELLLPLPSKEPNYRKRRGHKDFLCNVAVNKALLREALQCEWGASQVLHYDGAEAVQKLLYDRYHQPEWNLKF